MDSTHVRPDIFKVFDFISNYKLIIMIIPVIVMIAALLFSFSLSLKYNHNARFLLGHYWLNPQKDDMIFFLDPINLNRDINLGLYNLDVSQAAGISTRELNYYSRIIDDGLLEITSVAPLESKGTEVIANLISLIQAAEDEVIAKHRRNTDTIRQALELYAGTKDNISKIKSELSTVLNIEENSSQPTFDTSDQSDLKMLWKIYASIVNSDTYLNSIERDLSELYQNYSAVSEYRKLTLIFEPARSENPVHPNLFLIGLIALFMGLTGAVLLALIIDSIRKYRIERTISS